MICPNCHYPIEGAVKFCPNCGYKLPLTAEVTPGAREPFQQQYPSAPTEKKYAEAAPFYPGSPQPNYGQSPWQEPFRQPEYSAKPQQAYPEPSYPDYPVRRQPTPPVVSPPPVQQYPEYLTSPRPAPPQQYAAPQRPPAPPQRPQQPNPPQSFYTESHVAPAPEHLQYGEQYARARRPRQQEESHPANDYRRDYPRERPAPQDPSRRTPLYNGAPSLSTRDTTTLQPDLYQSPQHPTPPTFEDSYADPSFYSPPPRHAPAQDPPPRQTNRPVSSGGARAIGVGSTAKNRSTVRPPLDRHPLEPPKDEDDYEYDDDQQEDYDDDDYIYEKHRRKSNGPIFFFAFLLLLFTTLTILQLTQVIYLEKIPVILSNFFSGTSQAESSLSSLAGPTESKDFSAVTPVAMSEPVTTEAWTLSVASAQTFASLEGVQPAEGMEFLVVDIKLTNNSTDQDHKMRYYDYDFTLISGQDFATPIQAGEVQAYTGALGHGLLAGGQEVTGGVIYSIPKGSTTYTIYFLPRGTTEPQAAFTLAISPGQATPPAETPAVA